MNSSQTKYLAKQNRIILLYKHERSTLISQFLNVCYLIEYHAEEGSWPILRIIGYRIEIVSPKYISKNNGCRFHSYIVITKLGRKEGIHFYQQELLSL